MKNDRPAKCEQKMSTLNVTSGRSAKCKKVYAKCEESFGQLDDQSYGQFGQFGRPGKFFRHFGGSGCQNVKH